MNKTEKLNYIFEYLSEEGKKSAMEYLEFLADREGRKRAEHAMRAFEAIDKLLDGDTGWASEEEMMEELLAERRARP